MANVTTSSPGSGRLRSIAWHIRAELLCRRVARKLAREQRELVEVFERELRHARQAKPEMWPDDALVMDALHSLLDGAARCGNAAVARLSAEQSPAPMSAEARTEGELAMREWRSAEDRLRALVEAVDTQSPLADLAMSASMRSGRIPSAARGAAFLTLRPEQERHIRNLLANREPDWWTWRGDLAGRAVVAPVSA